MSKLPSLVVRYSIYLLVFLLPVFWLPFSFEAFEFNKQYLLFALVSVGFFAWLAKQILVDKEIRFKRTPLDLSVLVFMLIAIISSVFSVDKSSSLFGFYGRFSDSLINILSLGVLYFLITNNTGFSFKKLKSKNQKTKTEEEVRDNAPLVSVQGIINAFVYSFILILVTAYFSIFGVWQYLNSLLSNKLPQVMLPGIFNPVGGSLESLSIFLAASTVFLAGFILTVKRTRILRIIDILLLVASVFLLLLIDFSSAWIVLLASLVLFIAFSLWKRIFKEDVNKLLLPIFLSCIAVVFLFVNTSGLWQSFTGKEATLLNSLPKEQVLAQSFSWPIALKASIADIKSGFVGSGVGTWNYDFAKFKPQSFNNTYLWQLRFDRAGSHISEVLGTMGILGFLSYLFLIGMFAIATWFIISQKPQSLIAGLQVPILLAFLALLIGQFVYYQNSTLAFSFWLMMALSVVAWQKNTFEHKISFKEFPELSLIFSIALSLVGLSFVVMYFFAGKIYVADAYYRDAVSNADIGKLERAVSLNQGQSHYKTILARSYFNQILAEMQKPEAERDQSLFAKNIYLSITYLKSGQIGKEYIKGSVDISPNRVSAWESLAMIYRDIQGLAGGASDWAAKSFERAIELEPTNPVLHTELGKIYLEAKDVEKAKQQFQAAKELKPDYADATIQTSLLYEKDNNFGEAIKEMESLANVYPYDVEILFQLGRLYFNNKDTDKAIDKFKTIILLMPNHSNARYSLAMAYQAKGDIQNAIAELEKVLELNPGNPEVQAKLDEVKGSVAEEE